MNLMCPLCNNKVDVANSIARTNRRISKEEAFGSSETMKLRMQF